MATELDHRRSQEFSVRGPSNRVAVGAAGRDAEGVEGDGCVWGGGVSPSPAD